MLSRSRTGGGPPSSTDADVKKRLMENVEHGGEATTAAYAPEESVSKSCFVPPPWSALLSTESDVNPACARKAAIPSGDIAAVSTVSPALGLVVGGSRGGSPGGWSAPGSTTGDASAVSVRGV
eukprot:5762763-Pleurochrysis_carterae.AAC.1